MKRWRLLEKKRNKTDYYGKYADTVDKYYNASCKYSKLQDKHLELQHKYTDLQDNHIKLQKAYLKR